MNTMKGNIEIRKRSLVIIAFIFLFSCKNGFYDYYKREDLWRLPLKQPYELYTIAGATRNFPPGGNWHLKFKTLLDSVSFAHVNLTMINVSKGIIYGYGTMPLCDHFIINTNTGFEKTYKDTLEWQQQLAKLNVNHKVVYDVMCLIYLKVLRMTESYYG